jgi:hypothetical protein
VEIAKLAKAAQARVSRPYSYYGGPEEPSERADNFTTEIADPKLREAFETYVRGERWVCGDVCVGIDLGKWPDGSAHLAVVQRGSVVHLKQEADGTLVQALDNLVITAPAKGLLVEKDATEAPKVEVRPYSGRQIYIDGQPVGQPFE